MVADDRAFDEGSAEASAVPPMNDSRADLATVAKGGTLNFVGAASNALLGFALILVVTRGVSRDAAGIFFESIALLNLLAGVAQWGAETGLVRAVPQARLVRDADEIRQSIRAALIPVGVAGLGGALVMFALAAPLGNLLTNGAHGAQLEPIVRILAPFLPVFALFTVALGATRGFGTMLPTVALDKVGRAGLQLSLALVAVSLGLSSTALALAWATPLAIGLVIALVWLAWLVRSFEQGGVSASSASARSTFVKFWKFTAPRGLAGVFAVTILWLGTLLIGALRSSAEAGVYAAATRYLVLGQFVGVAISQVAAPKLSELIARGDQERTGAVYRASTTWLVLASWPLYITMLIMAPALLSIFGEGYVQATTAIMILGASMLVATAVGPVDVVLLMAGKSRWNLSNTVVAVVLNIGLNLLLIPSLGLTGAAIAWSASILANNLLPLVEVWMFTGHHPFGEGWAVAAGLTLLTFGPAELATRWLLGPTFPALIVAGVIAGAIFAAGLWIFRGPLRLSAFAQMRRKAVG
jgi:O-antigen/teichoic acid export membrane protein